EIVQPPAQLHQPGAVAFLRVVEPPGQGPDGVLDLLEAFGGARAGVVLEPAQPLVPLAQLLGDVVQPSALGGVGLLDPVQPPDQAGDRLVDAADGQGGAALGRLQTFGDGVDRGQHAGQVVLAVGV